MKTMKYTVLLMFGLLLSACATTIKSDVTAFHSLTAPNGRTFTIEPIDPAMKGSLEFKQYAGLVRGALIGYGFRADTSGSPDLVVHMGYGISEGAEKIRSYPSYYPYYGFGYGYFGHYPYYGGFWDPFYYPYAGGYGGYMSSYTVYTRRLELNITDRNGTRVYEGRTVSVGRDNSLPDVMPFLVQAMFTDFPGQSGVTKHVAIKTGERGSGNSY